MQRCSASTRLDTGPLKPDGDWPGVFIRGDEAIALAQLINYVNKEAKLGSLTALQELFMSAFGPK